MQVLLQEFLTPHICRLTLNRPQAANALDTAMALALAQAFGQLGAARVVILTGAGERAFCAGADLKEREGMDENAWERQHKAFESAFAEVRNCPVPVIAAVQGAAYAGGLELALACDFILATPMARFALTEATLGIMPGLGGTQALSRTVGERLAKEMLFTGAPLDAQHAYHFGLVNSLHAPEILQEHALAIARKIAANAPLSIKAIKAAMREGEAQPLHEALKTELAHYYTLIPTNDRAEGNRAFLERRTPQFTGG